MHGVYMFIPGVTDDVFKSTVHRAINRSGVRRYSIPLFFGTDYDVRLEVRHEPTQTHTVPLCFPLRVKTEWIVC